MLNASEILQTLRMIVVVALFPTLTDLVAQIL